MARAPVHGDPQGHPHPGRARLGQAGRQAPGGQERGKAQERRQEGPPQAPRHLERQALALGGNAGRRLARPGLHLPPQAQAAEAPLPRPRQEAPGPPQGPDRRDRGGKRRRAARGRLPGRLRRPSGEPPDHPRRVRRRPRPGAAARLPGPGRRGPVVDPAERCRRPQRPGAYRRTRQPARPRGHLGPRPPLVARPDGPHQPAAGRADGARLPRLVRHLGRRRVESPADDRPVEPLPRQLLRLVPRSLQGGDGRPGDAPVAERRRKREGRAERELRPRDDGAVQPRRRSRRLHRGRHPRTGALADRLHLRMVVRTRQPQLPLRPEPPRHRHQDGVRQVRQLGLGRRLPAMCRKPVPPLLLRRKAVELLRRRAALGRHPRAPGRRSTSAPACRSARCSRKS